MQKVSGLPVLEPQGSLPRSPVRNVDVDLSDPKRAHPLRRAVECAPRLDCTLAGQCGDHVPVGGDDIDVEPPAVGYDVDLPDGARVNEDPDCSLIHRVRPRSGTTVPEWECWPSRSDDG